MDTQTEARTSHSTSTSNHSLGRFSCITLTCSDLNLRLTTPFLLLLITACQEQHLQSRPILSRNSYRLARCHYNYNTRDETPPTKQSLPAGLTNSSTFPGIKYPPAVTTTVPCAYSVARLLNQRAAARRLPLFAPVLRPLVTFRDLAARVRCQ